MGLVSKVVALAAAMVCVGAAEAQGSRTIDLSAKAAFKHRHSKVELPPALAGLPRTKAAEYEADQLDVMAEYATPDVSEAYTVYIYRNVAGGLPIWFDRARWMAEHRAALGTATLHRAGEFVPPGRNNASGLLATYAVTGTGYRSTGVAVVPVGEWLIKLRASSQTLSADELEARMKAALSEIGWPKTMAPTPAATLVTACATGLALSGDAKPAEKDEDSGAQMLMGALLGQMGAIQGPPRQTAPPPETHWCRDSIELPEAGVYRAGGQTDGYFVAMSDAGRGVSAGRSAGQLLLDSTPEKPSRPDRYEVQMILFSQTLTSAPLDRLPPPTQALAIARAGHFATSFGTWGKGKGQIVIGDDVLK